LNVLEYLSEHLTEVKSWENFIGLPMVQAHWQTGNAIGFNQSELEARLGKMMASLVSRQRVNLADLTYVCRVCPLIRRVDSDLQSNARVWKDNLQDIEQARHEYFVTKCQAYVKHANIIIARSPTLSDTDKTRLQTLATSLFVLDNQLIPYVLITKLTNPCRLTYSSLCLLVYNFASHFTSIHGLTVESSYFSAWKVI